MIGTTGAAMPAASALPQTSPLQADAANALPSAETAAAPEARSSEARSPASGNGEPLAPQAPAHAQGTASKRDSASASRQEDFATLLRAGTAASAAAAPRVNAAPASIDDKGTDAANSDGAALPDQLLALLDGSWMQPSLAAGPVIASSLQAMQIAQPANSATGATSLAASAAGFADRGTAPDLAALAIASPTEATAGSAVAVGATDGASDVLSTAVTSDANGAISSFAAIVPASANAPAARALMAAPVTVPADPQTGFDDGFGARLVWMAEQRLGHAEIRLNPEHLGPIEVRVQIDGTQVNAEFQSAHAGVRQAIEASLPRLRDMLGQQGLQLGQADVGQRHEGSGQPAREGADGHPVPASSGSAASGMSTRSLRSRGLLDEYA